MNIHWIICGISYLKGCKDHDRGIVLYYSMYYVLYRSYTPRHIGIDFVIKLYYVLGDLGRMYHDTEE